ncbi:tetratricopeptide repeat protein [Sphingobacteriaceae bacterium WQ 2009]|uniref:Tetratricopeptide repeat protein n=1 Tax=Rhinopithecimicrobium faecis TaxID=2820698 RepID=A0A8T4H8R0_9SPHI|nr:tetratricopeptide repeat protein [Sphingobacteriaceae bacterium WQ 2009]
MKMKEALPLFLQARACLNTMDWKDVQAPEKTFQYLSFYFGTIGETQLSIDFLEFAKNVAPPKSNQLPIILDNLGLLYLQLKDTTYAITMFKQAEAISFELKDYARLGRVLGNMAEIHKKRGEIDLAIALIKQDIEYSKTYQDEMNYMYANIALADLYLIKKDYTTVQAIIDKIDKIVIAKKNFWGYQLRIYQLKLKLATAKGDYENELLIRRKISAITDSLDRYNGDNTIKDMKWAAKVDSLKNKQERQQLFSFNLYTISFLLLTGVAACFYLIQNRRVRKVAIALEEDHVEENILPSYAPIAPEPIIDKYQFLTETHLMTEEAWHDFKLNFSHKYPHFLRNIVREFPELTETNLRYITLEKLGFKPQEIAGILGITLDAIKKAKQRLKKKLAHRYRQLEEYPLNS